ncbi:MAG: hypothetical protein IJ638_00250 [Alphaproteobacteria bacterium]|nr:hypothetical protein [Alphaproteobacteria bacterium]
MANILRYLILIFTTALFALVYFRFLKFSLDKVLSKEKSFNFIYFSFIARILLTIVFFYLLLKYYHDIQEIFMVVIVFLICRFLVLRKDKSSIKKVVKK